MDSVAPDDAPGGPGPSEEGCPEDSTTVPSVPSGSRRRVRGLLRPPPNFPHIVTAKGRYKKLHPCRFCSTVFHKAAKLVAHERTHTGERPFRCDHCSAAFSRKAHLLRHVIIHDDADNVQRPTHRCDSCGFDFKSRDHLKRHQSRSCAPGKPQCPECGLVVASAYHLRRHVGAHERSRTRAAGHKPPAPPPVPFVCDECFETLPDRPALRRHIAERHGFPCPECGVFFPSADHRRDHMKTHVAEETPPAVCPHEGCGRTYTRVSNLRQHIRSAHSASSSSSEGRPRGSNGRHQRTRHPDSTPTPTTRPQDSEGTANDAADPGAPLERESCPEVSDVAGPPARKRPKKEPPFPSGHPNQRGPYHGAFLARLLGVPEVDLALLPGPGQGPPVAPVDAPGGAVAATVLEVC
jgi:hypothetical protein